jgi:hypothetical protein
MNHLRPALIAAAVAVGTALLAMPAAAAPVTSGGSVTKNPSGGGSVTWTYSGPGA